MRIKVGQQFLLSFFAPFLNASFNLALVLLTKFLYFLKEEPVLLHRPPEIVAGISSALLPVLVLRLVFSIRSSDIPDNSRLFCKLN